MIILFPVWNRTAWSRQIELPTLRNEDTPAYLRRLGWHGLVLQAVGSTEQTPPAFTAWSTRPCHPSQFLDNVRRLARDRRGRIMQP